MFHPGEIWYDTDGKPIQAHGGGILYDRGVYYWFGENKDGVTYEERMDVIGVSCYSSRDLVNWHNEGIVLPSVLDDPQHDLHPSKIVERPKVVYNAKTGMYVMWLHIDTPGYVYARAGVAVSPTPTGPYRYLGSLRPCDADSRDLTVYQDDGAAYLIFSSEWHRNITIALLTDDYLQPSDAFIKTLSHPRHPEGREAPAVFKYRDRYYMISSACTGWYPNAAEVAVASSMLGTWQVQGNPCVGEGAEITFDAQSTSVLPVAGKDGAFIFMADRWNSRDLADSRYVWLPIQFEDGRPVIRWRDHWDLSVFDDLPQA